MQQKIVLVTQENGSYDCGLCCVQMIMLQAAFDVTLFDLKKHIEVYDGIGTFLPQLGVYLLENDFKVSLIGLNPHLFTKADIGCSQKQCSSIIDKRYSKLIENYIGIERFPKFITAGGVVIPQIIDAETLENALQNNTSIIANVSDSWYHQQEARYNFHFICITGYDENNFFVHDPLSEQRGLYPHFPIKKKELLYAIHCAAYGDVDNACCLFIDRQ